MTSVNRTKPAVRLDEPGASGNSIAQAMENFFSKLEVYQAVTYRNFALFPLANPAVTGNSRVHSAIATLQEGQSKGYLQVSETGDVGHLTVKNVSRKVKVLLCEGDVLKGGAQNRTVNVSTIVGESSEIMVPTSCVEQGRWRNFSAPFTEAKSRLTPSLQRAVYDSVKLNAERSGGRSLHSDQAKLWREVSTRIAEVKARTATDDYEAVFEAKREELQEATEKLWAQLDQIETLVGFVSAAGGDCYLRVVCCNGVREALRTSLRSCFLEAGRSTQGGLREVSSEEVAALLDEIPRSRHEILRTPGIETNVRYKMDRLSGSVILLDGAVVHIDGFGELGR